MNIDRDGSFDIRFIVDLKGSKRINLCFAQSSHTHRADYEVHAVGRGSYYVCHHHMAVLGQRMPKADLFLLLNPNDPR